MSIFGQRPTRVIVRRNYKPALPPNLAHDIRAARKALKEKLYRAYLKVQP